MRNRKYTRNEHTRQKITDILSGLPSGSIIDTQTITAAFKNYYRGANNRNISCLMRERDDTERIGNMTWRKI